MRSRLSWVCRRSTASFRCLPNCLIVGAQKAGTSSLYHYLTQHPRVHSSYCKEVHFFDGGLDPLVDTYANGEHWYRAHFPFKHNMNTGDVCIDASPLYLFNPQAPERIKAVLPDTKIIILLRDPVERAISHYFHVKRRGFENLNIEDALAMEKKRLMRPIESRDYKALSFRQYSYQARGMYLEQILRFQKLFTNEQILIIGSDELLGEPEKTLTQTFNFLAIDSEYQIHDLEFKNIGGNKQEISKHAYKKLTDHFRPHNEALFEYLGTTFPWRM